jgi:type I restriction enzyme R subunit
MHDPHSDSRDASPFFDRRAEKQQHLRNLPHWQQGEAWCFVTWRLADSIAQTKLADWEREKRIWLLHHPKPWDGSTTREYRERFPKRFEAWLDQGSGSCFLRDPLNARIVADALLHFDQDRYEIAAFVIMPNHVHALFRPLRLNRISEILKSWKSFTARSINKRMQRSGGLWQQEYWDRLVRSDDHFKKYEIYIAENPAKANLRPGEFILYSR